MVKVRVTGAYPIDVLGVTRQPQEVFEVPDEVAADLCREGRPFERVSPAAPGEEVTES